MTKFTLEKILKKLIKRNYITNQSIFTLEIGDDVKRVCRGDLNNKIDLLAPVDYVYITYNNSRKNLIEINDHGLYYPLELDFIKKELYKYYKVNTDDISKLATIKIVCKKLPDIFLESFLYKDDIISISIYYTLLKHHNTLMIKEDYIKCIDFIKLHKKDLIKQYGLIPIKVEYNPVRINYDLKPEEILNSIFSKIFNIQLTFRKSHDYEGKDYYIIEEDNSKKWIKSKE